MCADDVGEAGGGRLQHAGFRRRIHVRETESRGIAIVPFVIVRERPREIAAYVVAVANGAGNRSEMVLDIPLALRVVSGSDAILSDHHRLAVTDRVPLDFVIEATGVNSPTHHGETFSAPGRAGNERDGAGGLRIVVVDANDVADVVDAVEMVRVAMDHRVENKAARVERRALPP